jgi:hypothetical protein
VEHSLELVVQSESLLLEHAKRLRANMMQSNNRGINREGIGVKGKAMMENVGRKGMEYNVQDLFRNRSSIIWHSEMITTSAKWSITWHTR